MNFPHWARELEFAQNTVRVTRPTDPTETPASAYNRPLVSHQGAGDGPQHWRVAKSLPQRCLPWPPANPDEHRLPARPFLHRGFVRILGWREPGHDSRAATQLPARPVGFPFPHSRECCSGHNCFDFEWPPPNTRLA